MGREYVMKAIAEIKTLAEEEGLDFFPTIFEHVNRDIMLEACSYGLPTRSRHWSYGRSYQHQKIYGEMGLSKGYEIVFNNNPSYAFLMNTNPDVINIMVSAHVFGHVQFFKHNIMFKDSDRSMVYRAAERAARVDEYIEQYGIDAVEHLMDIGFALDRHIDWHRGMFRDKYPKKRVVETVKKSGEFDDLLNISDNTSRRSVVRKVVGDKLPPYPEKDLLWFLINYAPLEDWERDILGIIREESFYFYPIAMTKIINEGWACVLKDTPIYTDNGIMNMEDVVGKRASLIFDGENTQKIYDSNIIHNKDIYKVHTKRGLVLGGSNNHRILMNDMFTWKQLDELKIGDKIKISGGNNIWSNEHKGIEFKSQKATSKQDLCKKYNISYDTYYRHTNKMCHTTQQNIDKIKKITKEYEDMMELGFTSSAGNRKSINIPKIVDNDMGAFLGYIVGDGHISTLGREVGLTSGDSESMEHFDELLKTLFGLKASQKWDDSSKTGRWRITAYSKTLIDFLINTFGFTGGPSARTKQIPSLVLQSPRDVVSAFLRSYFDCDGCASEKQGIILSTSSDKLAEQTQIVLMNYGILSHRKKAKDECWQLRVTGRSAKLFYEEIGFGLSRKQDKLKKYIDNHKWFKEEKCEDVVTKIEYCGKQDVYDISVENSHRYAAAGFINHNSFWHAEIMYKYDKLSETEYIDFAKIHSSVINPGNPFNINPYYLGFKIFTDIRERWDKMHENGEADINGTQKIFEVAAEEDDASFLRNYLTKELAVKLGMFNYGYKHNRHPDEKEEDLNQEHGIIELKDRDLDKIIENIIRPTINYGAPLIAVEEVDGDTLVLCHGDDFGPLDKKYAEKTMEYMYELWGSSIELKTYTHDEDRVDYIFDESGFEIL